MFQQELRGAVNVGRMSCLGGVFSMSITEGTSLASPPDHRITERFGLGGTLKMIPVQTSSTGRYKSGRKINILLMFNIGIKIQS